MRNCDFGLLPSANHATRSSRVSTGVISTWSRAILVRRRYLLKGWELQPKGGDHIRSPRGRAMTGGHDRSRMLDATIDQTALDYCPIGFVNSPALAISGFQPL